MSDFVIRFAEKKDLGRIIELCALHAEYERADYSPQGKKSALRKQLFAAKPSLHCLIAEFDQKVLGYCTYTKQFSTWDADHYIYMDCLFLVSEARGMGIGEQLLEAVKSEASKLGCQQIQWQTPSFNKRAIRFYTRIGASSKLKERFFLEL